MGLVLFSKGSRDVGVANQGRTLIRPNREVSVGFEVIVSKGLRLRLNATPELSN